jgi:RND family efflux transporter MFP subunit
MRGDPTRRRLLGALVAGVLPAGTLLSGTRVMAGEPPPMAVGTVVATRSEIVDTVLVDGTLVAREEVLVGPQIDGLRIVEILADEGDVVVAGQVLARLDRSTLDVQLAQSDAALARAQAAVAQAGSQIAQADATNAEAASGLERSQALARSGIASRETLDQRIAAARGAAARLAAARDGLAVAEAEQRQIAAQRRDIELRLARTEIRAPLGGLVSRRVGRLGAIAGMGSEALFRIVAGGEIELEAEIPEAHLAALAVGQTARIDLTGGVRVNGRVRLVPAEVDRTTRLGRMRVALEPAPGLAAGRFARGAIETGRRTAIALPLSAVRFERDGAAVQLVVDGRVRLRDVRLGSISGGRAEIREGLREGEVAILRAGAFLRDGDAVRPVP